MTSPTYSNSHENLAADKLQFGVIAALGVANLLIAYWWATFTPTLIMTGTITALAFAWFKLRGGTPASMVVLPLLGVLMVAIHINAGRGLLETHFAVFAYLATTLVYRNWIPVLTAALATALHHVIVNELQLFGLPVFCFPSADRTRVFLHAAYVVAESGVLIYLAIRTANAFKVGQECAALFQHVARPDGTFNLNLEKVDVRTPVAQQGKQCLEALSNVVDQTSDGVQNVANAAQQIADSSADVRDRTTTQLTSLQETASAVEQIALTARGNVKSASKAKRLVSHMQTSTDTGNQTVTQLSRTMAELSEFSQRVNTIVGVIDGIAFQTNILALNAAVEAARAGEQGRGFAVVASEVRTLAQRAGVSAKEIRSLIERSSQLVASGEELATETHQSMAELLESVEAISQDMGSIHHGGSLQAERVESIQDGICQLLDSTTQNQIVAEQSDEISQTLSDQVNDIRRQLVKFDLGSKA